MKTKNNKNGVNCMLLLLLTACILFMIWNCMFKVENFDGYDSKKGMCIDGYGLGFHGGKTGEECASICNDLPECGGFLSGDDMCEIYHGNRIQFITDDNATTHCNIKNCDRNGAIWNSMANGYTCGDRIMWSKDNQDGGDFNKAKNRVAKEFPNICGPCRTPTSQTPPQSVNRTCDDVWDRMANGYTCGDRIMWSKDNYYGGDLNKAKNRVAGEFPDICGPCRN